MYFLVSALFYCLQLNGKTVSEFYPPPSKTGWAQIEEKAKYSSVEKWHTSDAEESVK